MQLLKALIFDVDGTLAETEELHRAAFNMAFKDAGLDWHWDQPTYGRLLAVTGGKERLRHFLSAVPIGRGKARDMDQLIGELHATKTQYYTSMVSNGQASLRPGISNLIDQAHRAGLLLAIATTTSRPNVTALLNATLPPVLVEAFSVIVAGDDVAKKKPAPDVYHAALAGLALPAHACLAIEDSENGLRAAYSAGIPTLVTTSTYTRNERFNGACSVVAALTDLAPPNCERDQRASPSPQELMSAIRRVHANHRPPAYTVF